jgi:hypothetical protein
LLKKLSPVFSFTFEEAVWKIEVTPTASQLFLELRDADQHQVQFAAVDLSTARLLWQHLRLDEPWWVTLAMANERYLLLQSFTDTHNPEEKSSFAVAVDSQEMVWQSDHFQVIRLEDHQLFGYDVRDESRNLVQIRLPEGAVEPVDTTQKVGKGKNKDVRSPFFYSESQPYFTTVADFVESLDLPRPTGGCEYLEYGTYVCIAYYVPNENANDAGLANYLLILDQDGTILLHECLEVSVPKTGLGTFFIARDQLIVVQHKLQLVSYALS